MQLEYAQQIPPDLSIMMHDEPVVNADAGQSLKCRVRGRWLDRFDRMNEKYFTPQAVYWVDFDSVFVVDVVVLDEWVVGRVYMY
jgi:hypothetical protein